MADGMSAAAAAGQPVPVAAMRAFARDAFRACKLPERDAEIVADALVEADLTGADAHGNFRLAQYVRYLRDGNVNATPDITVVSRAPACALVDGDNGMGHLVMTYAANLAVEIARESGVGWVGVRRSNHAGAGGIYAAMPVEHGMVGVYAAVSGANHMALSGGLEPLLGTNPIAFGIPAGEEAPVILDIATSVGSNGAVQNAALQGKSIPEGWMISRADGTPITDPKRSKEGVLQPIGGYKGSGLALIIGLLGGVLNGAAFGRDLRDVASATRDEPSNTGQFVVAVDVSRFIAPDVFKREVDRHLRDLRSSKTLPGVASVRLPGEERRRRRADRLRDGLAFPQPLFAQFDKLAGELGIAPLGAR